MDLLDWIMDINAKTKIPSLLQTEISFSRAFQIVPFLQNILFCKTHFRFIFLIRSCNGSIGLDHGHQRYNKNSIVVFASNGNSIFGGRQVVPFM
jgi:hypothetical protein